MDRFSGGAAGENMNVVYSGCRDFERRNDFDVFSMSDYTSCENCRHFNEENRCVKKREKERYDL
ncbi:MAG: hypothetical protein UIJ87_02720 [Anaerovoracaceae bacterium]|nr:hypothetical protein [Anaerovoracaceae bacterium]